MYDLYVDGQQPIEEPNERDTDMFIFLPLEFQYLTSWFEPWICLGIATLFMCSEFNH